MKHIKRLLFTFCLIIMIAATTFIGFSGKSTIYSEYEAQRGDMPYMSNVFMGIHDGVFPLDVSNSVTSASGNNDMVFEGGGEGDGRFDFSSFAESNSLESVADDTSLDDQNDDKDQEHQDDDSNLENQNDEDDSDMQSENEYSEADGQPYVELPEYSKYETLSERSERLNSIDRSISDDDEPQEKTFKKVNISYLDDALFIGDSRVVGLAEYSGIDNATFFSNTGISVFKLFSKRYCQTPQGLTDLATALSNNTYNKIYIQVGINEIGTGDTDYYINSYREVVDRIKELQPQAILFLQGIIRVTRQKENNTFSNKKINERNEAIKALCNNRDIFYLEVNDAFCDEDGYLKSEYSFDGVHMYAKHYVLWKDYILEHGIL